MWSALNFHIALVGMCMIPPLCKSSAVSYKVKHKLTTYFTARPLPGFYPKAMEAYIFPKTDLKILIAACFTNAGPWKEPSAEWMNKCGLSIRLTNVFCDKGKTTDI